MKEEPIMVARPEVEVRRYELDPYAELQFVEMPQHSYLLSVQMEEYEETTARSTIMVEVTPKAVLEIWAMVDPTQDPVMRGIYVAETGKPFFADQCSQFVGAVHSWIGEKRYVAHVFDAGVQVSKKIWDNEARSYDAGQNAAHTAACFLRADLIEMLTHTDALFMLLGWEASVGARLEHMVAATCGLQIIYRTEDVPDGRSAEELLARKASAIRDRAADSSHGERL